MTDKTFTIQELSRRSGHSTQTLRYMLDVKVVTSSRQKHRGVDRQFSEQTALTLLCVTDIHKAISPGRPFLRLAAVAIDRHHVLYPKCHKFNWDVGPHTRIEIDIESNRKLLT